MYVRTKLPTAAAIAVAGAAALALAGCTADQQGGAAKPSAPSRSSTAAAGAFTRDTVEREVREAVRRAGIDPERGRTTTTRDGRKHPTMVDWAVAVDTGEADRSLPAIGAELERLGWRRQPRDGGLLGYEKSDWHLLATVTGKEKLAELHDGDSMLSLVVMHHSPD
ncbi:hypothetical protein ABZW32_20765 [Streptomyces sp. NPDC004667]|uniref:hypothetical protein n=1 Tax=Streptomyces sp. NPDC004667 TaxID=3154285 RepID=UPI00339DE1B7